MAKKHDGKASDNGITGESTTAAESGADKEEYMAIVRFPLIKPEISMKIEGEEAVERDSNPLVLWQVYALGGYLIGKWVWSKLQERKADSKKNSSGEDQSLSNE